MYKVVGGRNLQPGHLISFDKLHVLDEFALKQSDFATVSGPEHHKPAVDDAMKRIRQVKGVGERLAGFAEISRDLEICCWPGVPGEFLCPEEAAKAGRPLAAPTIMWDPYRTFAFFGTAKDSSRVKATVQQLKDAAATNTHGPRFGTAATRSGNRFQAVLMPAWVVLAHEIGHFYHYRHEQSWFLRCLNSGDIAAIERKNLDDHENPILQAIGLPQRDNYQDFKGGSNDTADKHIIWDGQGFPDPSYAATPSSTLTSATQVFEQRIRDAESKKLAKDQSKQVKLKVGKLKMPSNFRP